MITLVTVSDQLGSILTDLRGGETSVRQADCITMARWRCLKVKLVPQYNGPQKMRTLALTRTADPI